MNKIVWNNTYYGQSPGDLNNLKNGFAGRFSGYAQTITEPYHKMNSKLPVILIVGDSIIGNYCISAIRNKFHGIAHVNVLQQPHHCKNIDSWLEVWKIKEWTHYHCIFWFDGMHGFPFRVTEEEHQTLTPLLIGEIKKSIKNILWCNCTPIPDDLPKNEKNSERGPNSIEQILTNDSVINRNKSIIKEMNQLNIELLDIYKKVEPIVKLIQIPKNIHFYPKGEIIIGNLISNKLLELFFN